MNSVNEKKKHKGLKDFFKTFTVKELVWFVVGAIFFAAGLSFNIVDVIGRSINIPPSKNPILIADAALKTWLGNRLLGFIFWGIVFLILGAIIIAITLSLASRNEDRDKERQARREQRLQKMVDAQSDVVETSAVVTESNESSIETPKK